MQGLLRYARNDDRAAKIKEITGWHGPRPKALPVAAAFFRFITVKHTRIIEEYTKGIFHHEGHEEKNPLEITDQGKGIQECPFLHFLDLFRALRVFVVRTMGWEKDANHKSMLHREEPLL